MPLQLALLNRRIVSCERCPRLVEHREAVAGIKRRAYREQEYWGRPVPGFGQANARIVIVGLAPGAHGANRTGRMFTGDESGAFLYSALHRAGLASSPNSIGREDGLQLTDCYITAAVRCAPPANKPTPDERCNCRSYLIEEIGLLSTAKVFLCLGHIAFEETQRAANVRLGPFKHGAVFPMGMRHILCSYHVSQQNTYTRRLTVPMFDAILTAARVLAGMSA